MSEPDPLAACAAIVARGDPARFRATMMAPVPARRVLFPLYAMNVEIARAPWVTTEPMIAEMRLQWWRDALGEIASGGPVRRHEVTVPLAAAITPETAARLDRAIAARRWDIYRDPFEHADHFAEYIDETAGTLLWAAATSLGKVDETTVRQAAHAQGIANWLQAVPELERRGRHPLPDRSEKAIADLANTALNRLKSARANRHKIAPAARPALFAVSQAAPFLKQAVRAPHSIDQPAEKLHHRATLALRVATGHW